VSGKVKKNVNNIAHAKVPNTLGGRYGGLGRAAQAKAFAHLFALFAFIVRHAVLKFVIYTA